MSRRVAILSLILFVYAVGAALLDPLGHLSNDVGGKTASVAAMADAGNLNPDLGYWFEDADPDGAFFPLRNSRQTATGVWINSTSITTLVPAVPLWSAFGPRGILLIPILGALATVAVAGALARRINPSSDGTLAMLVVGLASPAAIYALDFWEHTWGMALMGAGIVLLYDSLKKERLPPAVLAGALFGIAATMRQEALVYAFGAGVTLGAMLLYRRQIIDMLKRGVGFTIGFAIPFLGYGLVEQALIGGAGARSDRGFETLERTGSLLTERITSSATWLFAPIGSTEPLAIAMGAILVASAAAFARWLFFTDQSVDPGLARKAMIATWAVWLIGIPLLKPGWIPGMLIAAPAAIFGMAAGIADRRWTLLALSVGPVPIVFATAFVDGSAVQWGSRYLLPTALVLTVLGIEGLRRVSKPTLTMVVVASLLVTLSGSVWTVRRSHWIADDGQQVVELAGDDVVVWASGYTAREMSDFSQDQRWLTVEDPRMQPVLAQLLSEQAVDSFVWIADRRMPAPTFDGYEVDTTLGAFEYEAAFPNDLIRYVATGNTSAPESLPLVAR